MAQDHAALRERHVALHGHDVALLNLKKRYTLLKYCPVAFNSAQAIVTGLTCVKLVLDHVHALIMCVYTFYVMNKNINNILFSLRVAH